MSKNKSESPPHLALLGLSSGIATCALQFVLSFLGSGFSMLSDAVFGTAIAWYFWRFRGVNKRAGLVAFVLGSVLAFRGAAVTAMFSPPLRNLLGFSDNSSELVSSDKFFFGGCVGAFLLLVCGYYSFLSSKSRSRRFVLISIVWSLAGGILAMLGWALGSLLDHLLGASSLGTLSAARSNLESYSLFIVWQTGMAPLFGRALPIETLTFSKAAKS